VGLAISRYADLHHERWPKTAHTTEPDPVTFKYDQAWIYTIAPFMEDVDAIRICTNDPAGDLRLRGKGTSYTLNGWLSSEASTPNQKAFDARRKLKSTSKTIVAFELSELQDVGAMRSGDPADIDVFKDHVHSFSWFNASNITAGRVFKYISREVAVDRHAEHSHFLYADGHVELISSEQVSAWAAEPFDFSKPQ
jgi:prepilin-type processing-associated H-X9-DG protein